MKRITDVDIQSRFPVSLIGKATLLSNFMPLGKIPYSLYAINLGFPYFEGVLFSREWHGYQFESGTGNLLFKNLDIKH
jgi:hypothetical protein